jgi:hypothetical protein
VASVIGVGKQHHSTKSVVGCERGSEAVCLQFGRPPWPGVAHRSGGAMRRVVDEHAAAASRSRKPSIPSGETSSVLGQGCARPQWSLRPSTRAVELQALTHQHMRTHVACSP